MKRLIVLPVLSVLLQLVLPSNLSPDETKTTITLKRLEERLKQQHYLLLTWRAKLRTVYLRHFAMRKVINKMNDASRITSFELNFVPKQCVEDIDRFRVLQNFAEVIGMQYKESDIVEIKYFYKKKERDRLKNTPYLNYIIKAKTLAIKEAWLNQFLVYIRKCGYKEVFDFPGVCKEFLNENVSDDYRKFPSFAKKYSLVNVTMRDHISPFKASLMAVVRGKIKPRRHYFRVKVNRSNIIVDRLMPMRHTVRHYVQDFSDVEKLCSL